MHLHKLTTLLQTLTADEMDRLNTFVQSPYFRMPAASAELFYCLKKDYPAFEQSKITPPRIAAKIPALPTANQQSKAASALIKAVEQFLTFENLCRHQKNLLDFNRLESFKNHHLFDAFTKELAQRQKEINRQPISDFDTLYQKHIYTELGFNNFSALLNRKGDNNIAPVITTLDEFHALKKLRYLCEAVHRHYLFKHPVPPHQPEQIFETLKPYNNTQHPYVYLFCNCYRLFTAANYAQSLPAYRHIKKYITAHAGKTGSAEIAEVMPYVISYCQRWVHQGVADAGREQLWWIEFRICHQQFLINGKILPTSFCNTVTLYRQYGTPEQINRFINTYSEFLPAANKEVFVAFARGVYYYAACDYANATAQFQLAQAAIDPVFNCLVKRWYFITAYDAHPHNTTGLDTFLESYEKYVQRNTEQLHHFAPAVKIFIAYARTLLKCSFKTDKQNLSKQLHPLDFFAGKDWLLQKCNPTDFKNL